MIAIKDFPYPAYGGGAEPELNKDGAGSSWVEREGGVDGHQDFYLTLLVEVEKPELNKDGAGSSCVEREGGVDGKQGFTLRC